MTFDPRTTNQSDPHKMLAEVENTPVNYRELIDDLLTDVERTAGFTRRDPRYELELRQKKRQRAERSRHTMSLNSDVRAGWNATMSEWWREHYRGKGKRIPDNERTRARTEKGLAILSKM